MNYQQVLAYLERLQMHKMKLGLEAMELFLERVGRPEKELQFVHLAGTNGKGTVGAVLSEVLHRSYYRIGVYTSPHLSSVRERFRVGDKYISEADFARVGRRIIEELAEEKITYFEFTTALALLWFAECKVDLVILETGMGGRLDATNVVRPLVSVITSISMDHQGWLGDNLAAIAVEKAGIIKPGVPVISAVKGIAADVIGQRAEDVDAPLFQLHEDFGYVLAEEGSWSWHGREGFGRSITGLVSKSQSIAQQENESLALAVLPLLDMYGFRVADAQIRSALISLNWPGRMELLSVERDGKKLRFLLDGAHNSAGMKNLAATLKKKFFGRRLALLGSMADKEMGNMFCAIASLFELLVLTRPQGDRSAAPEEIYASLVSEDKKHALCEPDVECAFIKIVEHALPDDLVVVAGSLYLVGAVRFLLCGEVIR